MRFAALIVVATVIASRAQATAPSDESPQQRATKTIEVKVTQAGFEPRVLHLKKGEQVALVFTRVTDETCIRAIEIPDEKVTHLVLPLQKPVRLTFTPQKTGTEPFYCSAMGMGDGRLVVGD